MECPFAAACQRWTSPGLRRPKATVAAMRTVLRCFASCTSPAVKENGNSSCPKEVDRKFSWVTCADRTSLPLEEELDDLPVLGLVSGPGRRRQRRGEHREACAGSYLPKTRQQHRRRQIWEGRREVSRSTYMVLEWGGRGAHVLPSQGLAEVRTIVNDFLARMPGWLHRRGCNQSHQTGVYMYSS